MASIALEAKPFRLDGLKGGGLELCLDHRKAISPARFFAPVSCAKKVEHLPVFSAVGERNAAPAAQSLSLSVAHVKKLIMVIEVGIACHLSAALQGSRRV